MNIDELYQLGLWFKDQHPQLSRLYQELLNPVKHNAREPNKQPVQEQMDNLFNFLRSMSFKTLSIEQINILDDLGVAVFIGDRGAEFVEKTIKQSNYDPATASEELQNALNIINSTNQQLNNYMSAISELELEPHYFDELDGYITLRVGFRGDASIGNVVELKSAAADWHEIIRGVAIAAGEAPEDTRVVGAGTGSLILFLASTAAVTLILAQISKHLTSVTHDVLSIQVHKEKLKREKFLTSAMEVEFDQLVKEKEKNMQDIVIEQIKKEIPNFDGEKETALRKSITKMLRFYKKGGDLDFVSPTETNEEEDDESDAGRKSDLLDAKRAIEEYHEMRDSVQKLLE